MFQSDATTAPMLKHCEVAAVELFWWFVVVLVIFNPIEMTFAEG